MDKPEVYGLPSDPVTPTNTWPAITCEAQQRSFFVQLLLRLV